MKRLRGMLFATLALAVTNAGAAESIYGVWLREGHKDRLEFYDCDGKLCAKGVQPLPDGSEPPLILRHANKTGPAQWKGDLFNPENNKTYSGTIALDKDKRDKMTLTGCLIAFLCMSETWTRIPKPVPAAAPAGTAPVAAPGPTAPAAKAAPPKTLPAKPAPAAPPPRSENEGDSE